MVEADVIGRVLGVIKHAHVDIEDHTGELAIVFDTFIDEASAACQWIMPSDERFISLWEAMHGNVDNLVGKTAWVDTSRPGLITFIEMAII
jgi:hypothetical protein